MIDESVTSPEVMGLKSDDTKISGLERTDKTDTPAPRQDQQKPESKLYQPRESTPVAGEVVDFDQNSDERDLFPFVREARDGSGPKLSVAGVSLEQGVKEETPGVSLVKISDEHGRTYDIDLGEGALWGDTYGGLYGSLGIKGNNLEDAHIERDKYSPFGFKVKGLQDEGLLRYAIQRSRDLRRLGIETEKTDLVIKPSEFVVNGQTISVEDFKRTLVERARSEIAHPVPSMHSEMDLKESDVEGIESYLARTEFYFSIRSLQVAERFRDLRQTETEEDFRGEMSRVFRFINQREKMEAESQGRDPRLLDPAKPEDIEYYFTSYLPSRLAKNIARLHAAGYYHGFLTGHNMSLVGGLYDLDSVAKFSEDPEVREEQLKKDFESLLELQEIFNGPRKIGSEKSWFAQNLGPRFSEEFFQALTTSYLDELSGKGFFGEGGLEKGLDKTLDTDIQKAADTWGEEIRTKGITLKELLGRIEKEEMDGGELDIGGEFLGSLEREMELRFPKLFYGNIDVINPANEVMKETSQSWLKSRIDRYVQDRNFSSETITAEIERRIASQSA